MSAAVLGLVTAALGAVGAVARLLADRWLSAHLPSPVPVATVVVNTVGSFALGVVAGAVRWLGLDEGLAHVLGAGLLGAFTTFSTVSLEAVELLRARRHGAAAVVALGGLAVCLAAGAAGLALTAAL